ncbi:hypothetical protein ACFL1X_11775, partial [Candidatus Hydrogenedentota bacterium]
LHDFEAAYENYSVAKRLESGLSLGFTQANLFQTRLALLEESKPLNWKPIEMWVEAEEAPSQRVPGLLAEILSKYPQTKIADRAFVELWREKPGFAKLSEDKVVSMEGLLASYSAMSDGSDDPRIAAFSEYKRIEAFTVVPESSTEADLAFSALQHRWPGEKDIIQAAANLRD